MLAKQIKYTDYNGVERNETFYFNLSKAELLQMQFGTVGGMDEYLKKIIETQDTVKIMKEFTDLILKSYGVKSDDGKRFIKSEELSTEFAQTEAFTELLMDMVGTEGFAADFVSKVMPTVPDKNAAQAANVTVLPMA